MKFCKINILIIGLIFIIPNHLTATMTFVNLANEDVPISIACDHSKNFPNDWTGNTPSWYIISQRETPWHPGYSPWGSSNYIKFSCSKHQAAWGKSSGAWSTIIFGRLLRMQNGSNVIYTQTQFRIEDVGDSIWYILPNGCVYWQNPDPKDKKCLQRWK